MLILWPTEHDDTIALFPVEPPDGVKHWPEIKRQRAFLNELAMVAPHVFAFAIPNAGKRNPRLAKLEGITAGVFDLALCWGAGNTAWCEWKGYTAAGCAGVLSKEQKEWGNRMTRLGHHCAAFFTPAACFEWLREIGVPMNRLVERKDFRQKKKPGER